MSYNSQNASLTSHEMIYYADPINNLEEVGKENYYTTEYNCLGNNAPACLTQKGTDAVRNFTNVFSYSENYNEVQ